MIRQNIGKVCRIIKKRGDNFWQEKDNEYLFEEIVAYLNIEGYDLKLIKTKPIK